MGSTAANAVQQVVASTSEPSSGVIATIIGVITLLLGASGIVVALQPALNLIWEVPPRRYRRWWGPYLRQKLIGFAVVAAVGFFLVLSLSMTTAVAAIEKFFSAWLPVPGPVLEAINFGISFGVLTFLFAFIFRFLPDHTIAWRHVWPGAAVTAFLFTVGKILLGLYLGRVSVGSAYGAAGSLIVVLVWIYYSAQVFFFGAEFAHVYAKRLAVSVRDLDNAETGTDRARRSPNRS